MTATTMFHRAVRPKYANAVVIMAFAKRKWFYGGAMVLFLLIAVIYAVGWAANDAHAATCDSIYYNLLRVKYEKSVPAVSFIREFFETADCDDIFNMSVYRHDYATKINKGDKMRLQRIIDFKSNETDEAIAAQAVLHYHDWHERRLLKAVSWWSSWSYYTSVSTNNILVMIGLGSSAHIGVQMVSASYQRIKDSRRKDAV